MVIKTFSQKQWFIFWARWKFDIERRSSAGRCTADKVVDETLSVGVEAICCGKAGTRFPTDTGQRSVCFDTEMHTLTWPYIICTTAIHLSLHIPFSLGVCAPELCKNPVWSTTSQKNEEKKNTHYTLRPCNTLLPRTQTQRAHSCAHKD